MSEEAVGHAVMTAMQDKVVLMKTGSHLPPRLLMKLRSTCKAWNQSFVLVLRSCSDEDLILSWPRSHERGRDGELRNMRAYIECMRWSLGTPFSQFNLPYSTKSKSSTFEAFLSVCGNFAQSMHLVPNHLTNNLIRRALFGRTPNLTGLTLHLMPQISLELFILFNPASAVEPREDDEQRLQTELPQLRRLKLYAVGGLARDFSSFPLVKDILCNAVNLDTLEIHDFECMDSQVLGAVWDLLGRHLHNIKTFRIQYLRAPDLHGMIEAATRIQDPLRLEEFTAEILFYPIETREEIVPLLYQFLATQSTTLRELELYADVGLRRHNKGADCVSYAFGNEPNVGIVNDTIRFPRMEALYRLRLGPEDFRDVGVAGYYNYGSLPRTFPLLQLLECNVETFQFHRRRIADVDADVSSVSPITHEGVSHIVLSLDRLTPAGKVDLNALASTFQSVTHLKLVLSTLAPLTLFIGIWPGLVSLHVKFREWNTLDRNPNGPEPGFLDAVLSGIPQPRLIHVRRDFNKMTENPLTLDSVHSILVRYKTAPGLSDLHHLKEFVLDVGDSAYRVTDVGGYLAFAVASPHLQRLAILQSRGRTSTGQNLISAECRELIKKSFHMYADIGV